MKQIKRWAEIDVQNPKAEYFAMVGPRDCGRARESGEQRGLGVEKSYQF